MNKLILTSISVILVLNTIFSQHLNYIGEQNFIIDEKKYIQALISKELVYTPFTKEGLQFEERSNFSELLRQKYPTIKSFVSTTAPYVYIDIYQNKISAFCIKETGAEFLIKTNTSTYQYIHSNSNLVPATNSSYFCGSTHTSTEEKNIQYRTKSAEKVILKTYRLALALTGEFSRTMGTNKDQILAGLNEHLTRINAVYIKEHAIEFKLVPNNDSLLYTDPATDPYINGNPGALMDKNVTVLNEVIGINNYDIGHVFGTNAGGVALLGTVCKASKAAGSSSTFGVYNGINFYLIPCHELGHQFSAEHTFNLCDNDNESSGSAFEPGSGSTIMSYAGASDCGPNYVQNIMDPYFHSNSLNQIKNYSRQGTGSLCGTNTDTGNNTPDVEIVSPKNITVPINTPFELTGKSKDATPNLYTWEQLDLGPKSILGSPTGNAPLFRSMNPSNNPTRIFPSLQTILDNKKSITEILPSTTRPLTFRFTVRDNDGKGGGTTWSDISFAATANAGPFKITSHTTSDTLFANDFTLITWDIANTDRSPVNSKRVDIYWSTDGGINFTKIIGETENDGNEWITIPHTPSDKVRIKVKATENIFFTVNNANQVVVNKLNNKLKAIPFPTTTSICAGDQITFKIKTGPSSSQDTIYLLEHLLPIGIQITKNFLTQNDSTLVLWITNENEFTASKSAKLYFINKNANDTLSVDIKLDILSGNTTKFFPAQGESQVALKPIFKWKPIEIASDYIIEVSNQPTFQSIYWSKYISSSDSMTSPDIDLKTNEIYYWRIRPNTNCITSKIAFHAFHTQSLSCNVYTPTDLPKFISATGTPRVTSKIEVKDPINLALITIPILRGSHDFVGDIATYLKAPNGDSVILFANECNNLSNFNLAIDDQAPIAITCPLTDRKAHSPKESMSNLIKSTSIGNWELIIRDTKAGSGGSIDEWSLQLCGAINNPGPAAFTNKGIRQFELRTEIINRSILEYTDIDSKENKLNYILLTDPIIGKLVLLTDTLKAGSTFTQEDINLGKLKFRANEVKKDTNQIIEFIVYDENKNWSGLQKITVNVLNDPSIRTKSENQLNLKVYPNPFNHQLTLELPIDTPTDIIIYDISGKVISTYYDLRNKAILDLPNLVPGMYILRGTTKNGYKFFVHKITKL